MRVLGASPLLQILTLAFSNLPPRAHNVSPLGSNLCSPANHFLLALETRQVRHLHRTPAAVRLQEAVVSKRNHKTDLDDKYGSACLPPAIENGKYEEAQSGGYKNHDEITVTCEDGFDMKLRSGRIQCSNGRWSRLPVCERSIYACDKPGKIRHAVIINQEPKEVYGHNSQLEYQCEDGYTTGQENHLNKITCQDGTWTEAQSCIPPCVLDMSRLGIDETKQISIKDGETKKIDCTLWPDYWMFARCSNGGIEATQCCHSSDIARNLCRFTRRL